LQNVQDISYILCLLGVIFLLYDTFTNTHTPRSHEFLFTTLYVLREKISILLLLSIFLFEILAFLLPFSSHKNFFVTKLEFQI
jgi:hypothetical protein